MLHPKGQIKRRRDVLVLKDICIRAIIKGTTTRKVKKSSRTLLPFEGKIDPAKGSSCGTDIAAKVGAFGSISMRRRLVVFDPTRIRQ